MSQTRPLPQQLPFVNICQNWHLKSSYSYSNGKNLLWQLPAKTEHPPNTMEAAISVQSSLLD